MIELGNGLMLNVKIYQLKQWELIVMKVYSHSAMGDFPGIAQAIRY